MLRTLGIVVFGLGLLGLAPVTHAQAPARKPNILVIWGDDIGQFNISAYNRGMMGYKTPNIDRIANEGALFTDWYGQQSCTAGRAAFITGQSPIRTGLTKVGLPGTPEGMKKEDPTIATLLRAQGYDDVGRGPGPDDRPVRDPPGVSVTPVAQSFGMRIVPRSPAALQWQARVAAAFGDVA